MEFIKITFNNGNIKEYEKGTSFFEISKDFKELKNSVLGVKINNEVISLDTKVYNDEIVSFFDVNDLYGYIMYKSALKMIFELALKRVFPNLDVQFEHSIPRGMLATVIGENDLTNNDIVIIKEEMCKIINQDIIFKKLNVKKKEAIVYYDKINEFEKSNNIRNISDPSVTLYALNNLINYYYTEMPYSTGAINKFDLIYLGKNKLAFLWPSSRSNGQIPEYVHYSNIIDSFNNGKLWLNNQKIPFVTDLNLLIENGKIKDFINSSEIIYNLNVAQIAKEIINDSKIKFVMIAGPSSSGKTTSCKRLASYLLAMGYDPIKISTDDYFVDRDKTPRDEFGNIDFECLNAVDVQTLNEDLVKLLNQESVNLPVYNFITGKREKTQKIIKLKNNSIILIEGLHSLNDELIPSIGNDLKYKIYLSPFIPLNIDRHNYISTVDLRLLRRIVRDNRTRGYGVATTINNWQIVRNGEEKFIFPYIHQANAILNTALAFEIGVLKVYVEPLLHSVGVDSAYYEEAQRLLNFLKQFFPIPSEYVNGDSILREFIGGDFND